MRLSLTTLQETNQKQKTIIIQITKPDKQKLPILPLENEPLTILKHRQGDISNQRHCTTYNSTSNS